MRKAPNDNHIAVRRCILTGGQSDSRRLIRLALSPDGIVAPDVRARAPGRGAWIGVTREALELAITKGQLAGKLKAAFKTPNVILPDNLAQIIDNALTGELLQRLGLEAKASQLISGAEKVETAARMGQVALLLHAGDAAENGRRSLDQAWRVGSEEEGTGLQGPVLPFDRDQLSQGLGRNNCVHIAITDHRAARRVALFLLRLLAYRGEDIAALADRVFGSDAADEMTPDDNVDNEIAAALI
jgi:predicted RNA-binding protein YlxR (DUF448 family)